MVWMGEGVDFLVSPAFDIQIPTFAPPALQLPAKVLTQQFVVRPPHRRRKQGGAGGCSPPKLYNQGAEPPYHFRHARCEEPQL